jgi:hypothetical protein
MNFVRQQDALDIQPSAGQTIGDSDIVSASAGLDAVSGNGTMSFVGGSGNGTAVTARIDEVFANENLTIFTFYKDQTDGNDLIKDFECFLAPSQI